MSDPILHCQDVSKTFVSGKNQRNQALDSVSLAIGRGEMVALLGPNGAGKSTLINIIAGIVIKDSGRISACGYDLDRQPRAVKARIGIVPQELSIDPFFTPKQVLSLMAGLYGFRAHKDEVDALLKQLELTDKANSYARRLSGGMRRRLMIAKAMIHNPEILILDEPTAGVDVELRRRLWAYVRQLNAQGRTIVLTTHYIEEAEKLCDKVAIIKQGQIIAFDTVKKLLTDLDRKIMRVRLDTPLEHPVVLNGAQELGITVTVTPESSQSAGSLMVKYPPSKVSTVAVLDLLREYRLSFSEFSLADPSLEDLFLELTHPSEPRAEISLP